MAWTRTAFVATADLSLVVVPLARRLVHRGADGVFATALDADGVAWETPLPGDELFGAKLLFAATDQLVTIEVTKGRRPKGVLWLDGRDGRVVRRLDLPLDAEPIAGASTDRTLYLFGRDAHTDEWVVHEVDLAATTTRRTTAPGGERLYRVEDTLYLDDADAGLLARGLQPGDPWRRVATDTVWGSAGSEHGLYFFTPAAGGMDLRWWDARGEAGRMPTNYRAPRILAPGWAPGEVLSWLDGAEVQLLAPAAGVVRWSAPTPAGAAVHAGAATPHGAVIVRKPADGPCVAHLHHWADGSVLATVPVSRFDVVDAHWAADRLVLSGYDGIETFRWDAVGG